MLYLTLYMFVGPNSITSPVEVQLNPIKHLLVQQCLCADQQRLYILSASRDSSLDGKFMGPTAAHFARQILEEPVRSMRRGLGFLCKAGCCIYFDTFLYREANSSCTLPSSHQMGLCVFLELPVQWKLWNRTKHISQLKGNNSSCQEQWRGAGQHLQCVYFLCFQGTSSCPELTYSQNSISSHGPGCA